MLCRAAVGDVAGSCIPELRNLGVGGGGHYTLDKARVSQTVAVRMGQATSDSIVKGQKRDEGRYSHRVVVS